MTVFEVTRDGSVIEDAVFDVDPVVDTSNPFGNFCVVKIDDRNGNKFEQYERGTRIDIDIDESDLTALTIDSGETVTTDSNTTDTYAGTIQNSGTYGNAGTVENQDTAEVGRFTGYVVERRETEQQGADVLEVEAYSFDQFLRRNTVTNDQTGNLISEALADIIQTDSPVTYDAGNVDVGDDQELTRSYQGETVENTLRDLAFKSNNEEFGVNDSLEFFFRPRESTHIDRGIDNTQWFNYDIPELGKQAINEVEVWFNGGDESVVVDDGTDKLDLQDNLNLPEPGTQRAELNRPELTDIGDAEDVGRKYLTFRNATLSGTVTTFGLYDAQPGDTIDITIDPRGIDTEFVIAGIEYRWGRDETILTIVEKRGETDEILADLNESVQRVEMADANRDAPSNRITTTNARALVDVQVDADGNTPDDSRFVNDGRRAVRDGWADKGLPAISNLVVGDDGSGLSRSNTGLVNQTNSAAVSESLPDAKSVEYSASITQTGVEELGLETSGGTLIARAVFDSPVDLDGTVTVTLDVSNDSSVSRGVLTNDGQTAVRDVLADNSPALPSDYAYGDGGSTVSESDTALGNQLVTTSLEEILLQNADTQSQWESLIGDVPDTTPFEVDDSPGTLQSSFTVEAEDFDREQGDSLTSTDGKYSDGQAIAYATDASIREWDFTLDYTIPQGEFELWNRNEGDNSGGLVPDLEWYLDGNFIGVTNFLLSFEWKEVFDITNETPPELAPGQHTIRAEVPDGGDGGARIVDVVAPLDSLTRFTGGSDATDAYTFDNDNGGGSGYLDGPELYPDVIPISLQTATTRRPVTQANFTSTWNDTSNEQYIELANDGSTFTRFNNTDTDSVTFAAPERDVDVNIGFSRFGSRTSATPQTGFMAQEIDDWQLFANPDAVVSDGIGKALTRGVIPPGTIDGSTIRESGLLSNSTLLTRHQLAEFTVESGQRVASAETTAVSGDET